jgi:hypothetical protein
LNCVKAVLKNQREVPCAAERDLLVEKVQRLAHMQRSSASSAQTDDEVKSL